MVERTIGMLGMCPADCTNAEGIRLSTGQDLIINSCPNGSVCVAVGGLAARYEPAELAKIGDSNENKGILAIACEIRTEPEAFLYKDNAQVRNVINASASVT